MEISAHGDAPGANQMVEGPVIDPTDPVIDGFGPDLLSPWFWFGVGLGIGLGIMGIMYACPEAKTSFWNLFGQRSNQ